MTAIICDSSARMTPRARPPGREVVRGREAEQKLVRELLRRAQRGTGGVLLVDGEPGIGKSLLLRDSTDQAAERGFSLAAGAHRVVLAWYFESLRMINFKVEAAAAVPENLAGISNGYY